MKIIVINEIYNFKMCLAVEMINIMFNLNIILIILAPKMALNKRKTLEL